MLTIICGSLNFNDYDAVLSIITTLNNYQENFTKLKEDLDVEKLSSKLRDEIAKLDVDKIVHHNTNLEADLKAKEINLN